MHRRGLVVLGVLAMGLPERNAAACSPAVAPAGYVTGFHLTSDVAEARQRGLRAGDPADINGTWVFDLDASEVAAAVREDCSTKSNPSARGPYRSE